MISNLESKITASDILPNLLSTKPSFQFATVKQLQSLVQFFYFEVLGFEDVLRRIADDTRNPLQNRKNVYLLLSKLYYYLNNIETSLDYALLAEEEFDFKVSSPYVIVVVDLAITKYTKYKIDEEDSQTNFFANVEIPQNLEKLQLLFNNIIDYSFTYNEYYHILGLAIEARRLDIIEKCLRKSHEFSAAVNLKKHCFNLILEHVMNHSFKVKVLNLLVGLYKEDEEKGLGGMDIEDDSKDDGKGKNVFNISLVLTMLGEAQQVTDILISVVKKRSTLSFARAMQLAFDLHENGTPTLRSKVKRLLDDEAERIKKTGNTSSSSSSTSNNSSYSSSSIVESPPSYFATYPSSTSTSSSTSSPHAIAIPLAVSVLIHRLQSLAAVVSGAVSSDLHYQFLFSRCYTDPLTVTDLCAANPRNHPILIVGTLVAYALMQCGTGHHEFFLTDADYIQKCQLWAKFTAVGCIGVIHRNHANRAFSVLSFALPNTDESVNIAQRLELEKAQLEAEREREYINNQRASSTTTTTTTSSSSIDPSSSSFVPPAFTDLLPSTDQSTPTRPSASAVAVAANAAGAIGDDGGGGAPLAPPPVVRTGLPLPPANLQVNTVKFSTDQSRYSESGAMFALGLIHAATGAASTELLLPYLMSMLYRLTQEGETMYPKFDLAIHTHGLLLAIGCAAMGNCDINLYQPLHDIILGDNVHNARPAAIAIGLIFLASGTQPEYQHIVTDLVDVARNNRHEAIQRAIGTALALMYATLQENADILVDTLEHDQNDVLRYTAAFVVGLAYVGTPKPPVVARLLHTVSSDPSPDVQRMAVISLGLLFADQKKVLMQKAVGTSTAHEYSHGVSVSPSPGVSRSPSPSPISRTSPIKTTTTSSSSSSSFSSSSLSSSSVTTYVNANPFPRLISPLCDSFVPHVRAGCGLALGIACATEGHESGATYVTSETTVTTTSARQSPPAVGAGAGAGVGGGGSGGIGRGQSAPPGAAAAPPTVYAATADVGSTDVSNECYRLLTHLCEDRIDHVRQGAAIGLGFLFMLRNEHGEKERQTIRKENEEKKKKLKEEKSKGKEEGGGGGGGMEKEEAEEDGESGSSSGGTEKEKDKDAADDLDIDEDELERLREKKEKEQEEKEKEEKIKNRTFYEKAFLMLRGMAFQHQIDLLAPFGALIGLGIMNAGGRNSSLRLFTDEHTPILSNIAGLALFTQFWYWHPYLLFLSLALTPTSLIAVDVKRRTPRYNFLSTVDPQRYSYPAKREKEKVGEIEKKSTVVLSVVEHKQEKIKEKKDKEEKDKKEKERDSMSSMDKEDIQIIEKIKDLAISLSTDPVTPSASSSSSFFTSSSSNSDSTTAATSPTVYTLPNPTRVVPEQRPTITYPTTPPAYVAAGTPPQLYDARYTPVREDKANGIVVLHDRLYTSEDEEDEFAPEGGAKKEEGGAAKKKDDGFQQAEGTIAEMDAEMRPPAAVELDDDFY